MSKFFFKKLLQSLTATLLVKVVGFARELLILRFFGITAFVSSILALNFFPSLVSTFLRYYIPNMSLGLMGESNETEKKSFENAVAFVKYFFIFLVLIAIYNIRTWDISFIISYFIYVFASVFVVSSGVEEFRGISKGKNFQVSFAAITSNISCIIVFLLFKKELSFYILPLTILTQSLVNFLLLKFNFDTVSIKKYFDLKTSFDYKKNKQLIGLITFIELIGMFYNLIDYSYITNYSKNIKLYQINTYALMFYNLPISIIGFTLSTLLVDVQRMHKILNIITRYLKWILLFILITFITLTLVLKGDNFLLKLFIELFAGKTSEKYSLLKIMSIYIPGIIPAIIVVVIAKIYLLENKSSLLFKIYLIGLVFKFLISLILINLGAFDYLCVSLSTTLSWLLVSLALIYNIKSFYVIKHNS